MNRNLLILGAGQYGMVAKEIAEAMNCFEKIDFLDDNNEIAIGKFEQYEDFVGKYTYAVVAMGNPELRLSYLQKLEEACFQIAILVHPKAYISPSAQLMQGTIVEPMAAVHTGSAVAKGCIISAGAVVNHNCFIGDGCHVDCGAVVKAGCILLAQTKVESGTVLYAAPKGIIITKDSPQDYSFEDGM